MDINRLYIETELGNSRVCTTQPVYQYDQGLEQRLYTENNDVVVEAHFSFPGVNKTFNVVAESMNGYYAVEVPDIQMFQDKDITCYVYVETGGTDRTMYEVYIPVVPRIQPMTNSYTEQEINNYDKLVAGLNHMLSRMREQIAFYLACNGLIHIDIDNDTMNIFTSSPEGASAYDIAVLNGFTGTQEEWEDYVNEFMRHPSLEDIEGVANQAWSKALEIEGDLGTFVENTDINSLHGVSTDANQGLTSQQKQNARDNIGVADMHSETVTIPATSWTGNEAPYTATVQCAVATASNTLTVGVGGGLTAAQYREIALARILCTGQGAGTITLTAYGKKPENSVTVNVLGVSA